MTNQEKRSSSQKFWEHTVMQKRTKKELFLIRTEKKWDYREMEIRKQ